MSQPTIAKGERSWTGIARKLVSGITGLALIGFIIIHLLGNLTLFSTDGETFNKYAHFLESQGILLYIAEAGLVLFFLMHAVSGIQVWLGKRKAKKKGYEVYKSSGSPSKQSLSSKTMIVSGLILLVFLVVHVATFKYNVHLGQDVVQNEFMTTYDSIEGEVRDLHGIVWNAFQNPIAAFGYTAVMIFLGFHLRHGVWSAFQSLGAMKPKYSPLIYTIGGILAVLLAVGFLAIPLYIYFS
jgi:succinate dehydrogenase / fumarate reductase cytochrome b subunit